MTEEKESVDRVESLTISSHTENAPNRMRPPQTRSAFPNLSRSFDKRPFGKERWGIVGHRVLVVDNRDDAASGDLAKDGIVDSVVGPNAQIRPYKTHRGMLYFHRGFQAAVRMCSCSGVVRSSARARRGREQNAWRGSAGTTYTLRHRPRSHSCSLSTVPTKNLH